MKRTHGRSRTLIFFRWQSMMRRCYDPKTEGYSRYGARGIRVCERWHKFEEFYEDMGEPPKGMTLERLDNNGDYCKENCTWASYKTQARNRRDNHLVTWRGETKTVSEWCEITGLPRSTVQYRYRRGWPVEEMLTYPVGKRYQKRRWYRRPLLTGSEALG